MTISTNPRTTDLLGDDTRASTLRLLVRQLRWESDGVVSLLLENADGGELPEWEPGAHLDLHLGGALVRQFSLCGAPSNRRQWRIAVLLEPVGRGGSHAVHTQLHPGMVLDARGPRNNFSLRPAGRYRFVAGGIGITPILAMVAHARESGIPWSLVYGGRMRSSMAFLDEFAAHSGAGGEVTVHPQDEAGLLPLQELFEQVEPDTLIYACGPEPLLAAMQDATAHWPAGSLVVERFSPVAPAASSGAEAAFEVEAAASGLTVTVEPGVSIVRALESVGIFPETSCEEGICGTCETRVLSGTPEHRDSLLSDDEREANETMMICVGRCRGERLVLDL
ncbi:PDR/VanB family oxidoreductase [Humibacillus sp. DSM 29435]|uniref:PDR/VanB family oxidoreductase n=1 Tax=Humibacillus sp. DSM 29435 TaxID=1869167 RepID=UPI000AC46DE4|nr:PDR/VanB family oxidoreductase [Humibacillus sp. DSM 29435]